jgi:hypothetical protein
VSELSLIRLLVIALWGRLTQLHRNQGGYGTEAALITAGLAALALTAVGIVGAKVLQRVNAIPAK